MENNIIIPAKLAAALLMACSNIDEIITTGSITDDVLSELKYLQPYLDEFAMQL